MNNKSLNVGMSLIVKTVARLTVGLILIYGIYIVLSSHSGPGSGFAGGVIIALSFILLMLAFGKGAVSAKLNQSKSLLLASLGALAFLILGVCGFLRKHSAGLGPLSEIAAALMVGMGLFLIFYALVLVSGKRD